MKLRLRSECDSETERWAAVFPEFPGRAIADDTEAEAIANASSLSDLPPIDFLNFV
jgi:predicted RNase H-like HicB family nuclease